MSAEQNHREELEREANERRERLAQTLQALDERRHRILSPAKQARRYALPLGGVAVAILVGFGIGEALSRRAMRRREDELRRLGVPVPRSDAAALTEQPMFAQIMRSAAVSLVGVVVSTLTRRLLAQQLEAANRPPVPADLPQDLPLGRPVLQDEPVRELELTVIDVKPVQA